MSAGFRVSMASGFDRFLAAPPFREAIKEELGRSLENEVTDPYDSHPSLRDRIEAVQGLISTEVADSSPPAFELLEDIGAVEQAFFDYFSNRAGGAVFRPLEWHEAPYRVLLPIWQKQAGYAPLGTTTFAGLPDFIRENRQELAREVLGLHDKPIPDEHLPGLLGPIIGPPIAAGLVREGFALSADLGEAVALTRDDIRIEPFAITGSLLSGDAQAEADWGAAVVSAGIGDRIIAEFQFSCSSCETAYDPEDYLPQSPEWHCSQCGETLPRD